MVSPHFTAISAECEQRTEDDGRREQIACEGEGETARELAEMAKNYARIVPAACRRHLPFGQGKTPGTKVGACKQTLRYSPNRGNKITFLYYY